MRRALFAGCLLALLAGCVARIPAPIQNDGTSLTGNRGYYRVLPGDTLYSIAFETGHDYRTLARWNHIPAPYRIEVGERLRLSAPRRDKLAPGPAGRPVTPPPRPLPVPLAQRAQGRPVRPATHVSAVPWIWPARGIVKETFGRGPLSGRPGNRGIDILGRPGEPVRAAAAGRVVYRGSRLPGYGKLIIIKENNEYLSAYAHNARIEVEEGAMVRQGEVIAIMGDSGTDRVELEFEIRRRGIPVNPLRYLPVRHH
ncbi:MAG: peptidoglycan DD-metalloendopeptidase family protein [Gammaproteobacteria bacterium]|jgi:lipoprotein NlpD|uniref:peptidoglycan DD-metalloendopeptidase family protein n=1 Tax=Acidiferrobacter sp. SPIII_3 TaxID=1281578 RepID=UPI000D73F9DF|nr:peptidoglycan DD-metalloendopeptidase family protein [Acidiferrobacter sp. SPIII_3]AWP23531.1 peptidase M23 [Acidiferrobacter sp. SPIII_3]MDA8119931.1 peptidoglycan DD-metalloendopeptidase family protein [Gammaproteobacteria bacterium]